MATPDRQPVDEMTDHEMLMEIVGILREAQDGLEALAQQPVFQAILSGQNPLTAMMGR